MCCVRIMAAALMGSSFVLENTLYSAGMYYTVGSVLLDFLDALPLALTDYNHVRGSTAVCYNVKRINSPITIAYSALSHEVHAVKPFRDQGKGCRSQLRKQCGTQ